MKGGVTQRVKISTQQGTAVAKLGGRAGVAKARRGALRQNPEKDREATLWAAGIERRASPVNTSLEAEPLVYRRRQHSNHGNRLRTVAGSGGVMTAAHNEGLRPEQVKALLTPRRKTSEKSVRSRRSEGGRWVRQSDEPPVMRWDAAKSRRRTEARLFVQEDPADRGTANQGEAQRS